MQQLISLCLFSVHFRVQSYAKFNSEELIWNNIVLSFLDIGKENSKTGLCGVSNFLNQLFTIVSAEPIQKTSIVVTIYDLLKDLINGLFGARYSGQSFKTIVPDATTTHPFDDFFQVKVLQVQTVRTWVHSKSLSVTLQSSADTVQTVLRPTLILLSEVSVSQYSS